MSRFLPGLLPALLLGLPGCEQAPADDFVFGQAWHMATAPQVFGADVLPDYAGCTQRASVDGQDFGFSEYDERGRLVFRSWPAALNRPQWTYTWNGPCLSRTELQTDTLTTEITSTCQQGWPIHTVQRTEHGDGVSTTAEHQTQYTLDGVRLTEVSVDDQPRDAYRWQGRLPVESRIILSSLQELDPNLLLVRYTWESDRLMAQHRGDGQLQATWTYDELDRMTEQHQYERGFSDLVQRRTYTTDQPQADTWTLHGSPTYDIQWECP